MRTKNTRAPVHINHISTCHQWHQSHRASANTTGYAKHITSHHITSHHTRPCVSRTSSISTTSIVRVHSACVCAPPASQRRRTCEHTRACYLPPAAVRQRAPARACGSRNTKMRSTCFARAPMILRPSRGGGGSGAVPQCARKGGGGQSAWHRTGSRRTGRRCCRRLHAVSRE